MHKTAAEADGGERFTWAGLGFGVGFLGTPRYQHPQHPQGPAGLGGAMSLGAWSNLV